MNIEYVKYRPVARLPHARMLLTANILVQLTRKLDPAELELAVLKDRWLESMGRGLGLGPQNLPHYVDTEGITQDALDSSFPPDGPDSVNMEDPFVVELCAKAWEAVHDALSFNYRVEA